MRFMADRAPRCLIGLEACGGAHYWGRWLSGLGFRVKMMSPQAVKPYVTGGHKNDPRDARAIAEAATRSHVSAVRIKSQQAQALPSAGAGARASGSLGAVQVVHQLRALLHEFGFIAPKGYGHLLRVYRQLAGSGALAGLRRRCHGTVCSPP